MPDDAAPLDTSTCRFMDALIGLLGAFPAGRDKRRSEALFERLESLEDEARQHGAPHPTIAAIQGAQVLLSLAEMPLPQSPAAPTAGRTVPRITRLRVVTTQSPSSLSDAKR